MHIYITNQRIVLAVIRQENFGLNKSLLWFTRHLNTPLINLPILNSSLYVYIHLYLGLNPALFRITVYLKVFEHLLAQCYVLIQKEIQWKGREKVNTSALKLDIITLFPKVNTCKFLLFFNLSECFKLFSWNSKKKKKKTKKKLICRNCN